MAGKIDPVFEGSLLSHWNNICQKQKVVKNGSPHQKELVDRIANVYIDYLKKINYNDILKGDFGSSVEALNNYIEMAKQIEKEDSKLFSWRSNFAGSIIPEFLYRIIDIQLKNISLIPLYSKNDSVLELSPDPEGNGFRITRKDQDFCVGFSKMVVKEQDKDVTIVIPTIAAEIKTNIDINKINGLEYTARRLKRSFPSAKFFLITETLDFSLNDNRASGPIDEVYVLRKQVRSQARIEGKKANLKPDVFRLISDDIMNISKKTTQKLGHVYSRLDNGRLII